MHASSIPVLWSRKLAATFGILGFLLLSFQAAPAHAQNAPAPFTDGTRWCAFGDSITHSGTYHEWVTLFYLTRFPHADIQSFNCGISGDTAAGGMKRLGWDVLPHHPTVTSVMFGMNDVGRNFYGPAEPTPEVLAARRARLDLYRAKQRDLVQALRAAGSQVILLSPSIYDESPGIEGPCQTGVDAALAECSAFLRELAEESGASFVDIHTMMTAVSRAVQAADPKATIVGPDRIHPGAAGHLLIAHAILEAQGVSPEIARLVIDLGAGQFVATNSEVEEVVRSDNDLRFRWTAHALPFPINIDAVPALSWAPIVDDLNQEILQVAGLSSGFWELFVDGESIATYSAQELASGVNLARQPGTPQYHQALAVMRLLEVRSELVSESLRSLAQVEHQSAPDIEHPVTLEAMQPWLKKRIESFAVYPPAEITRRRVELYPERKARESRTLAAIDRLWLQARRAAEPQPRIYVLRRVR